MESTKMMYVVRALANIINRNLNLSDELSGNNSLMDLIYYLESEDGDMFCEVLGRILRFNHLELSFEALWEYFVTSWVDLMPTDTLSRMAGGVFLCQVILEAGGLDSQELGPINALCQEFNPTPQTRDQHRANRSIHELFQEECTKLKNKHVWRGGSTSRYLRSSFRGKRY